MNNWDLNSYRLWFDSFVNSYCQEDPKDQEAILLKKDHSLRVLHEARQIMLSLDPTDKYLYHLVSIASLFHDIGRFPQYDQYKTFNDRISVNHGLLGYKVLRQQDILEGLSQEARKLILLSVLMHNRSRLPAGLPSNLRLILQVVRDADKLDIIPVVLPHFQQFSPDNGIVTLGLPHEPKRYSQAVIDQVLAKTMVDYRTMRWLNDFILLMCSWIYDVNFPYTCQAVLERGYMESLLNCLPQTEDILAVREQIRTDLMTPDLNASRDTIL